MHHFHIRKPLTPAGGSQFYKDRSNRGNGTYCGAPETEFDVEAKTRIARNPFKNTAGEMYFVCVNCIDRLPNEVKP